MINDKYLELYNKELKLIDEVVPELLEQDPDMQRLMEKLSNIFKLVYNLIYKYYA